MSECGDMGDRLDLDLDVYQPLGVLPAWIVERLWPGFVPQSYEVAINPVYVSRHMRRGPDYMERAAAFAQHAHELPALLARAVAFARYDGVDRDEAGITAFARVDDFEGTRQFIAIGMRLFIAKKGRGKPNYVTTVIPPVTEKRLRKMLEKRAHCLTGSGDDSTGSGSD
jgi:hypothetical protein